jgi:hypothetical protein
VLRHRPLQHRGAVGQRGQLVGGQPLRKRLHLWGRKVVEVVVCMGGVLDQRLAYASRKRIA